MKYVMTFRTDLLAAEKQRELNRHGIKSRIVVDPLESTHPELSTYRDVALLVGDEHTADEVRRILDTAS